MLGVPPPVSLPKKHFLSSTLNNPALVEERRKGLDEYLQAIVDSPDSKWRDSPPWRTFLNLPVTSSRQSKAGMSAKEEDWLEVHKQAKVLLQDARQHLSRRSTAPTIKDQHSESAAAKRCLVLAGTKVTTLQNTVEREGGLVGEGEMRRRRDLIRELNTEILGLERLSQAIATQRTSLSVSNAADPVNPLFAQQQQQPFQGQYNSLSQGSSGSRGVSTRRVFGAPPPETERTKGLENEELLQLQTTIMKEQDDQMDEFLRQVRRTRGVAEQIHEELDSHIDLLNGLDEDVDRVEGKIRRAGKRADKLK